MTDFNKIFKDAIDGYEAPFDATAWDKLSAKLSPLEDAVRDAVEDYEAPYDPKAWSTIKRNIGGSNTALKWIAGSAAAIGLFIGASTFLVDTDENNVTDTDTTPQHINKNTPALALSSERNNAVNANTLNNRTQENSTYSDTDNVNEVGQNPVNDASTNNTSATTPNDLAQNDLATSNGGSTGSEGTGQQAAITNTEDPTDNPHLNNDITASTTDEHVDYNATFTPSKFSACVNEEILFNPKEVKADLTYTWSYGDRKFDDNAQVSHKFEQPGTYEVELVISDKNGKAVANSSREIKVLAAPNSTFNWVQENNSIPLIKFNTENESADLIWKVNGAPIANQANMEYTFREEGNYVVSLEKQSEEGCTSNTNQNIKIEDDYNLLAPTAFAPTGDGSNDNFIPRALEIMNVEFVMTVFDQSGTLVFRTNTANNPWNGSNINTNAPEKGGAYVWIVRLKNGNGVYETYKGQVFLIR